MDASTEARATWLDLYDYRRRVAQMYAEREGALLAGEDPAAVLRRFRARKDDLFAHHPQSALGLGERARFEGLRYFPYNPVLRLEALLVPGDDKEDVRAPASGGAEFMPLRRAARLGFSVDGAPLQLTVYWIDVYGGGLFLPFSDDTCPDESYGGGRYLFDTVKGSDFVRASAPGESEAAWGYAGGSVVLDFNYAYNPSCAYDPRWVCPLAPAENRLSMPIRAGERKYHV